MKVFRRVELGALISALPTHYTTSLPTLTHFHTPSFSNGTRTPTLSLAAALGGSGESGRLALFPAGAA